MTDALFSLAGKHVLVTGGTRGIGRAIAAHFARAGAFVTAGYVRDDESAASLKTELAAEGTNLELCRADIATREGVQRVLDALRDAPPLAAVIHCAAAGVHRPVTELTLRHWDFTFGLNVRAFFDLVTSLLPSLGQGSSIVAVSSLGAVRAVPHYTLVGSSKGALEALARHLAVELAPRGIRVNVLSPGNVVTAAWDAFPDKESRMKDALRRSPRGELTSAGQVATAAHFLCSDAASGITGHTLVVDGGERVTA